VKEMDYIVSGAGAARTITPRSERAKARTPEQLTFSTIDEALPFVTQGVADGFRFSGRELIDKTYRLVSYAYYVRLPDGRSVFSGSDWGPPDPVFEEGDIYPSGPKNGKLAVVVEVITGEQARTHMRDVIVMLEERPIEEAPVLQSKLEQPERGGWAVAAPDDASRFGAIRPQISAAWSGQRWVVVGGTLFYSDKWKFFPDFLRDYVPAVFGKEWGDAERAKPAGERHPVFEWRTEAVKFMNQQPAIGEDTYAAKPNGFLGAYLSFAFDLYVVADNGGLDEELLRRLKITDQFLGARHELFAEATCLRAGFTIVHEDERDRTTRHVEFTATHKGTGEALSIEAKSRHRPGILGHPGTPHPLERINLRYGDLVNDALNKNPAHPLVIFIDTNLPVRIADHFYAFQQTNPPVPSRALKTLTDRIHREHGGVYPFAALIFTNHPHHYAEATEVDPRKHLLSIMRPAPPPSPAVIAIHEAANLYGNIPNFFPT
jgi:hypothetical protein